MFNSGIPEKTNGDKPAGSGSTEALNEDEKLLYTLANQERLKAGLPALQLDLRLVGLARLKSEDMFKRNYFSHVSPEYGTPLNMIKKYGVAARVMGAENIARAASARRAHALFMGSEAHRKNILDVRHDSIGIGVYKSVHGVVVTQLFLGS